MSTHRFTVLDLVYYCGERLWEKHRSAVRMPGGSVWQCVAFIFPVGAVMSRMESAIDIGDAGKVFLVLFFAMVLPLAVSYYVYHKRRRKERVMAHYRHSVCDNDFMCYVVVVGWTAFIVALTLLAESVLS